ncbi:MAG: SDR family oxidoreductase [Gammaproteobacteria bacterium]|nr:SDR family oxidoreductase [Gammaproteobacteria bacterium]
MSIEISYADKHVFVAGGSSGINLGIAKGFAAAGARVGILSRSQEKIDAAIAEIQGVANGEALGRSADVRNPDEVQAALRASFDAFGKIDVLVSGAAGNFPALAKDLSPNGFKAVVDIDLLGTFNVLRSSLEFLRQPGASVINISAPQATNPTIAQVHVCAAKAGVDMVTRVLAMEWGELGIRVNSIIPGPIAETEGMRRLAPTPDALETMARNVPLGRLGAIEDIAAAALLLSSPQAAYVTGAVIPVDGGWSLGGDQVASTSILGALAKASR